MGETHFRTSSPTIDSAQDSDLAHCFGDWSQSERHFKIKPPLMLVKEFVRLTEEKTSNKWMGNPLPKHMCIIFDSGAFLHGPFNLWYI